MLYGLVMLSLALQMIFVQCPIKKKQIWGPGEMAQCLRLLTAVTEDLDSVPSVHIRWLTVSCHFSSRIPLASLCMQCTPIHAGTCTHTHHLKQNETNFGCLLSPSLHSSLHSMILGLTFRLPWFWGCKPRLCTSRRSIAPPRRI